MQFTPDQIKKIDALEEQTSINRRTEPSYGIFRMLQADRFTHTAKNYLEGRKIKLEDELKECNEKLKECNEKLKDAKKKSKSDKKKQLSVDGSDIISKTLAIRKFMVEETKSTLGIVKQLLKILK